MRAKSDYSLNDNQAEVIIKALRFMADSDALSRAEKMPVREVARAMDIQRRRIQHGKKLGGQAGIIDTVVQGSGRED